MSKGISQSATYLLECAKSLLSEGTFVALTGAGISTAAGLPDYRGQGESRRSSPPLDLFLSDPVVRMEFWNSTIGGWRMLQNAQPTMAHGKLAELQASSKLAGVITQNVDGLHSLAGSVKVVELHGNDSGVICHGCQKSLGREEFMALPEVQPLQFFESAGTGVSPRCVCGGLWRPSNIFFGEDVPSTKLREAEELVSANHGLLILGTSLRVSSAMRILRSAIRQQKRTVLVNLGPSDGHGLVDVSVRVTIDEAMEILFDN